MDVRIEKDVMVTMRDGIRLATDIYRPVTDEPLPTVLVRTPYGKGMPVAMPDPRFIPSLMRIVEAGYAVVWQDGRGVFGSEGTFVPWVHETEDGEDTLRWLQSQPWADGHVGMYGRSGLGFPQWHMAVGEVEGLAAIVPSFTSADHYNGSFHHRGGLLSYATAATWAFNLSRGVTERRIAAGEAGTDERDRLIAALKNPAEYMDRLPVSNRPELAGGAPWFLDWVTHDSDDEYWRSVSPIEHINRVRAPALIFAGWFDIFLGENLNTFQRMRADSATEASRTGTRIVIGPWTHGELSGNYSNRRFGPAADVLAQDYTGIHLEFYDRWLKGIESAAGDPAPVRIFVMGLDQWRDEPSWPLPDTEYTDFLLGGSGRANTAAGDGTLSTAPSDVDAADRYLYDPLHPVPTLGGQVYGSLSDPWLIAGPADQQLNEARDDVLCYTSDVLAAPLEVTGPVTARLFASSSSVDTDFIVKLVDVHPDGAAAFVTEGALRARFRHGTSRAEPLVPDAIEEVEIELWGTSNVFLPGHQIRFEVTSSSFPRFDRNSNTGEDVGAEETVPVLNRVHHGPTHPSRLVLPIIRRGVTAGEMTPLDSFRSPEQNVNTDSQ